MKPIIGYEGLYSINRKGDVFSHSRSWVTGKNKMKMTSRDRFLSKYLTKHGYNTVSLTKSNKTKNYLLHRLVAETFIPNPSKKPHINHKNGIKTDNTVENLEWCTPAENNSHAHKTGLLDNRGEKHKLSKLKLNDVLYIRKNYQPKGKINQHFLAKKFRVSTNCIQDIIYRNGWRWV